MQLAIDKLHVIRNRIKYGRAVLRVHLNAASAAWSRAIHASTQLWGQPAATRQHPDILFHGGEDISAAVRWGEQMGFDGANVLGWAQCRQDSPRRPRTGLPISLSTAPASLQWDTGAPSLDAARRLLNLGRSIRIDVWRKGGQGFNAKRKAALRQGDIGKWSKMIRNRSAADAGYAPTWLVRRQWNQEAPWERKRSITSNQARVGESST